MNRKAYIIGRRKEIIHLVSPESEGGDRGIKYKLRCQERYNPRKRRMGEAKRKKMKRTIGLINVVAIAMALMIAFSGVASASLFAEFAPETRIGYDRMEIGEQGFDFWKSSSKNLLDNPLFAFGKGGLYGNVRDTSKELGLLPIIPASGEEVNAYSKLVVTDVLATTRAEVGITDDSLGLRYKIDAGGSKDVSMAKGSISAGMSVFAVDGSDGGLGSRLSYEEESTAIGLFKFHMVMDYTSKITTP